MRRSVTKCDVFALVSGQFVANTAGSGIGP
jgi:hypothetical protein